MKTLLLASLVGVLLCGCATTNTVEKRKAERYSTYSELSPEMRTLVDQGKLQVGMPMDAVYIAWGKPTQVMAGESAEGQSVIWLYHNTYLESHHYWGYPGYYAGGRRGRYRASPVATFETDYLPQGYVSGEVIFEDGIVKQWRSLPAPPH